MEFTLKFVESDGSIRNEKVELQGITEDELKEQENKWCKCNYLETHPNAQAKYVTNYMGEKHGWICPSCKKFTQIG